MAQQQAIPFHLIFELMPSFPPSLPPSLPLLRMNEGVKRFETRAIGPNASKWVSWCLWGRREGGGAGGGGGGGGGV